MSLLRSDRERMLPMIERRLRYYASRQSLVASTSLELLALINRS